MRGGGNDNDDQSTNRLTTNTQQQQQEFRSSGVQRQFVVDDVIECGVHWRQYSIEVSHRSHLLYSTSSTLVRVPVRVLIRNSGLQYLH